jgi:hypothetical protein
MRILPRSAKGTWLLAVAAWLGICTLAWFLLPPVPRGVARLPDIWHDQLLGFGPDCASVVAMRPLPNDKVDGTDRFALIVLDTATGEVVATPVEKTALVEVLCKSRDGRTWLFNEYHSDADRISQLDLTTRTWHRLPLTPAAVWQCSQARLSPDGRLAAIQEPPPRKAVIPDLNTGGLILWDTEAKKDRAYLRGLSPPFEFSADGRWLAVTIAAGKSSHVGIVDLESLRVRATEIPASDPLLETLQFRETHIPASDMPLDRGCLSDDGSHLAQYVSTGAEGLGTTDFELVCWNVATGAVVVREPVRQLSTNSPTFGRLGFANGGRFLVRMPKNFGSQGVRCYDLADGGRQRDLFAQEIVAVDTSPDGRFLLASREEKSPLPLQRIIRAVGLTWKWGQDEKWLGQIVDAATGNRCGVIPGKNPAFLRSGLSGPSMDVGWAPDGKSLAVQDPSDQSLWQIWDIPPRKPLGWFALGAAILALPLAGLAWRRSRRLRREAA